MVNLSCIDIEWDVTSMSVGTLEVAYKFPWKFPFPMFGHNMYVLKWEQRAEYENIAEIFK